MIRPIALTPRQEAHAADMYRDGYSRRQIAACLGVSDMAVRNALKRQRQSFRSRAEAALTIKHPHQRTRSRVASVWELATA